jgi:hypothetical protein
MPKTSPPPKFQIQSTESPTETVNKLIDAAHNLACGTLLKAGFSDTQVTRISNGNAFPASSLPRVKSASRTKIDETVIASWVLHSLREMRNAMRKGDTYAAAMTAFIAGEYHEKLKAARILSAQAKGGKSLTAQRRLAKDLRNAAAAELSSKNPKLSLKELHGMVNTGKYKVSYAQFGTDFKIYKKQHAMDWVSKFLISGALGRK